MGSLRSTALVAALAFVAPAAAVAATLDFSGYCCDLVGTPVNLPEATVTAISSFGATSELLIDPEIDQGEGQPFPPFGEIRVCPVTFFDYGYWCSGDLNINFTTPVTNLKFDIAAFWTAAVVSAFNPQDRLLGTFTVGVARVDLSQLGSIGRVYIHDTTVPYYLDDGTPIFEYGFDVANFSFDQQAVIPLPATLVLLLGALGVSGLFLRRSAAPRG